VLIERGSLPTVEVSRSPLPAPEGSPARQ
jgi:hypothetical protein